MDAPAKVNLVLQVGERTRDGLHEICSLFASLELCDSVEVEPIPGPVDVIVCEGVVGENLAAEALRALRATRAGARLPRLRVKIDKRIPIAAGLGGGSADAAAVLRAASALVPGALAPAELVALAARLGSDVPSQLDPRHAIVTGTGEEVEPVSLPPMEVVLVPSATGLSTADVYREADRIACTRKTLDPGALLELAARRPLRALVAGLENDLEAAALSLRPELTETVRALLGAGALGAHVTGSGPTVFGVFEGRPEADQAALQIPGAFVTSLRASEG
ncbi:MAG: 4-(cytidine 5'-diphospho)-2-C-methyl-D-erythritol kinase [Thermoleophilaceae bacterium]